MSIAEIHGKLPFEYSEDLLTSDAFATFRYLPADRGIIGFLRSAGGPAALIPDPDSCASCLFHFWPLGLCYGREPDVLLELRIGEWVGHVVVEAKYQSDPSDSPDTDVDEEGCRLTVGNQLADQFRDLLGGRYLIFHEGERNQSLELLSPPEHRFELYLTAHSARPEAELERAHRRESRLVGRLAWSSWYHVYGYLRGLRAERLGFPYDRVIDDALSLLERKGFAPYHGCPLVPVIDLSQTKSHVWRGE